MNKQQFDKKQTDENTEFVKDANDPKRNYIFQKNKISKTGFFIVGSILVLIIIGVVVSGIFFESPVTNP
ncbi:hypothetical protein [Aurantibacter sp.]|uniref:hypothetical protein n=1 Tax=Aurantibacter sp. TaxID=2807103 RepID=UPI003265D206